MPAQGGPGGAVGDPWCLRLDGCFDVLGPGRSLDVDGGDGEAVPVAGIGRGQVGARVGQLFAGGGRGDLRLVPGEDLLEDVDRGERVGRGWGDDRVLVAVKGGHQVDVVGGAAAGERHVQLLAGLRPGDDGVAGVGGDTLTAVHGGGVAELDVRARRSRRAG